MRVRKAIVAGAAVDPAALALLSSTFEAEEVPFELELTLADLRPAFFRRYAEWLADLREYPDPEDEVEAQLRALGWPSLGVLAEAEPAVFALVLLVLGDELLEDLEHGRDPLVPVRWVPREVAEVELRGRRIVLRGTALVIPALAPRRAPSPPS